MADNSVFITGVADGAFETALGALPPWATEKTAFTIEGILRKSLGVQTKMLSEAVKGIKSAGSGSLSPDDVKKVNNELDKLFKNLKRENEEGAKTKKRNKDIEKDDKENLARGKKLRGADEKLTYVLTGLASIGSKVMGVQEEYIDVYDSLYKSGINVMNGNNSTADGFEALNQLVNQTGLRLQTLQKVAEKYSTTMNVTGMAKFGKAVALSNTRMQELGFSSAENAELIGAMMESERGYSDIRGKTSEQIAADSMKLGQQFGRLSQTVGISRQQLLDNMQQAAKSADSTMVAAVHGEEAAKNMTAALAGIKDNDVRDMFLKMSASIDPIFTQMGKTFQNAGAGPLGVQIGRLAQDMRTLDPVEAQHRLDSLVKGISPGDIKALQARIAGGDSDAQATLEMLTKLKQSATGVSQATGDQQKAATNTEASIAKLQTETERLSAVAQAAFFPMVSQVNLVADSMKKLNDALYGAIGAVNAETRSWIGVGLIVAGLGAGLLAAVKSVNTFLSLFGSGSMTIGRAISGIGSVLGRLGGLFVRFLGPIGLLYTAFQLGTSIGETIYEMLTGVKNSINYVSVITDIFKDAGGWISEKFTVVKGWLSDALDGFVKGIKSIGNSILEFAPWLKTVGGYISSIVDVFKTVFTKVTGFFSWIIDGIGTFVKGVASKFANKMTFGLVGSDTSDFVKPEKSADDVRENATFARQAKVNKDEADATLVPKMPSPSPAVVSLFDSVQKAPSSKIASLIDSMQQEPSPKIDNLLNSMRQDPSPGLRGLFDSIKNIQLEKPSSSVPKTQLESFSNSISVPRTPVASTIAANLPEPEKPKAPDSNAQGPTSTEIASVAISKPSPKDDINSMLTFQSTLLEQILLSSNSLVSVNKEILRYTRNNA